MSDTASSSAAAPSPAATTEPSADVASPQPLRYLTEHQVNEANEKLVIGVLDAPGSGGASHLYDIRGFDTGSNPSCPFVARYGKSADHATVLFQNGPIKEVGVNGVTHEALLAILLDRMRAFQAGPYACDENAAAVRYLEAAQAVLKGRTLRRLAAGTEGTHKGT